MAKTALAPKPKVSVGRPTKYTKDLADLICSQIARTKPLARICDEDDSLPDVRTVYRWLREHDDFCQAYARAKDDQADFLAEQTLDIADDPTIDPADKRVRVDTRKWLASHLKPKKWGDKVQVDQGLTARDITIIMPEGGLTGLINAAKRGLEVGRVIEGEVIGQDPEPIPRNPA